jgi:hypothetical protein
LDNGSFVTSVLCKYFAWVCGFISHFSDTAVQREVFNLNEEKVDPSTFKEAVLYLYTLAFIVRECPDEQNLGHQPKG